MNPHSQLINIIRMQRQRTPLTNSPTRTLRKILKVNLNIITQSHSSTSTNLSRFNNILSRSLTSHLSMETIITSRNHRRTTQATRINRHGPTPINNQRQRIKDKRTQLRQKHFNRNRQSVSQARLNSSSHANHQDFHTIAQSSHTQPHHPSDLRSITINHQSQPTRQKPTQDTITTRPAKVTPTTTHQSQNTNSTNPHKHTTAPHKSSTDHSPTPTYPPPLPTNKSHHHNIHQPQDKAHEPPQHPSTNP